MTVKELKARGTVKATRRDNNFIPNKELMDRAESQIHADGWSISGYRIDGRRVTYSVFKEAPDLHKWYCKPGAEKDLREKAYKFLQRRGLQVCREYRDGDFLVLETNVTRAEKTVYLNPPEATAKEIPGVFIIRSKDYIFQFKDNTGKTIQLYGAALKKDMITENGVHYENERGVNLDYIFQE